MSKQARRFDLGHKPVDRRVHTKTGRRKGEKSRDLMARFARKKK